MTATRPLPLWIAGQVRNDVGFVAGGCSARRVPVLWIADQVRNDVTSCPAVPALWIPAFAGMTVRGAGMTGFWEGLPKAY